MTTKANIESILFLDIETVPLVYQYKDLNEEAKELWNKKWSYNKDISPEIQYAKAGIYAEFAKVICIGLGYYFDNKFRLKCIHSSDEAEILLEFSSLLGKHFNSEKHLLCAHNGREFDFPFLCRRLIINKLPLPKVLQIQGRKPWDIQHLDTMDLWKFGDIKNYSALDLLAYVFGIPSSKQEMDGSMVSRVYYEDHDLEKIAAYCKRDVITLARVYHRFTGPEELRDEDIVSV